MDRRHGLDGGADDLKTVEIEVVHVGGRVAAPQGAIHLEGVGIGLPAESLGVHHLDDVAGIDVLDALLDDGLVLGHGEVGLGLSAGREGRCCQQFGRDFQRAREAVHHALDLGGSRVIRLSDVAAVQPDMADHLDVVAQVVKHQQSVGEHEHGFRQALGVDVQHGHAGLEVVHRVIGDVAHSATVKRGQTLHGDKLKGVHLPLHQGQRVDRARGLVGAGAENVVGLGADETVAADALAAGHRFQQEGIGRPRDLKVGRHGSFEVGVDGAVDRAQVALSGQGADLIQSWVVHGHDMSSIGSENSEVGEFGQRKNPSPAGRA